MLPFLLLLKIICWRIVGERVVLLGCGEYFSLEDSVNNDFKEVM